MGQSNGMKSKCLARFSSSIVEEGRGVGGGQLQVGYLVDSCLIWWRGKKILLGLFKSYLNVKIRRLFFYM